MPLETRSRKSRSSRNSSTGDRSSYPADISSNRGEARGDTENSTTMSEITKEREEKRDFQPPPSGASSSPPNMNRELAPSSARPLTESQAMVSFPPTVTGSAPVASAPRPHEKLPTDTARRWHGAPQSRGSPYDGGRPMHVQGGPTSSSYPHYIPHSGAQGSAHKSDPGRREEGPRRSPSVMNEGSLGSIAAELDLAAKEHDDLGPTVADCLNLGSFGEDESPMRGERPKEGDAKAQGREFEQRRTNPKSSPRHGAGSYASSFAPPPYSSYRGAPSNHAYQPGAMYYPPKNDGGRPQPSPPPYGAGSYNTASGASYPFASSYPPQSYSSGLLPPPDQWTSPSGFPEPQEGAAYGGASRRNSNGEQAQKQGRNGDGDKPLLSRESSSTSHKTPVKKPLDGMGLPARSPFRSPVTNPDKGLTNSGKKFKRSPLFGGGTPSIGYYGSFGMDTPGGTIDASKLDEFSPMGPSFPSGFGDEATPFPLGGDDAVDESGIQFDPKLNISRVASGDDGDDGSRKRPVIRQRRAGELPSSPFSSFLGDMSPLAGEIRLQGSPVESRGRPDHRSGYAGTSSFRGSPRSGNDGDPNSARSFPPSKRSGHTKSHVLTSPLEAKSGSVSKQKKAWYDPMAPSPGPVRLELGDVGMKQVETRKSLEGINSMVRGVSTPHHRGYDSRRAPGSAFRNDMSTPIKMDSKVSSGGSRSAKGQRGGKVTGFPSAASGKHTPVSSASKIYPAAPKSASRGGAPTQTPAKSPATDKENTTPKPQRRNPCNCKKSKCLKLYCECFAAELFCDKCNCYDCRNTPAHETIRSKAIKDTRAKNPNAFKPRIGARPGSGPTGNSPPSGHNMGCRCKRSECLKKYCECFQAGVMCGSKCKCVDCLNYVGSQPLIDKRRKIKDHKGAEFAMRSADDAWKGKHPPRPLPPGAMPSPAPGSRGHGPHNMHMPPMIQPSPNHPGAPRGPNSGPPPPYGMAPYHMGPPMGYSPMGMPPVTPGYVSGKPPGGLSRSGGLSAARGKFNPKQQSTPRLATPRTPAVRLGFDPHSSKKKRKLNHGDSKEEATLPYFGPNNPEQPKTMALAVFAYLSNDDLYNAGIVCKRWSRLALDEELWQF